MDEGNRISPLPFPIYTGDQGLELRITPTVRDSAINLVIEPVAKTMTSFVRYGGSSSERASTSGIFQPIYGETCQLAVWDGATLVLQFPVHAVPGQPEVKRCLLVFITANLISPGGILKRPPESVSTVSAGF